MLIAFFTVFSIAAAPTAWASDSSNAVPVELKYIGKINNQPLFQLNFNGNADENEFTIIIRDVNGNTLYKENIKGENFYKKFLLNSDEIGDNMLKFEVISKKSKKSVVFQVGSETRIVNEVVVNKMK
jgi:hypothetical protein